MRRMMEFIPQDKLIRSGLFLAGAQIRVLYLERKHINTRTLNRI